MKYFAGLGIKFVIMLAVILIVLGGIFDVTFSNVLAISLILTVVSFLGDVFILPGIKNVTAAIADFFIEQSLALGTASFITALICTGAEIFFHMYMRRYFFNSSSVDEENQSTAPPDPEKMIGSVLRLETCEPSTGKTCTRSYQPKIRKAKSNSESCRYGITSRGSGLLRP